MASTSNYSINWGIIGCNLAAQNIAFNLHRLERHIGAVADANYLSAIRFAKKQMVMQALPIQNLLHDQQIDAIFLAATLDQQLELVKSALLARKNILYDQLGQISLADLQSLQELASQQQVLFFPNLPTFAMPLLSNLRQQNLTIKSINAYFANGANLADYLATVAALLAGLGLAITDLKLISSSKSQILLSMNELHIKLLTTNNTDLIENVVVTTNDKQLLLTSVFAPAKLQLYPLRDQPIQTIGHSNQATQYLLQTFENQISASYLPLSFTHLGIAIKRLAEQLSNQS